MAPSPALPHVPDELLDDILGRLDAVEDLASASVVCTSFRRVVCSRAFLRRFRSLHAPPVLGFLDTEVYGPFYPASPPHRAAPAARAFAEAADFTLSFVPTPNLCRVRDARGGRVLLSRFRTLATDFPEHLLVCDPLHRRYVQIPDISDESARPWIYQGLEPFLAPGVEDAMEEEEEQSFRVICIGFSEYNNLLQAFVFCSDTGKWQGAVPFHLGFCPLVRYYVRNCFYWACSEDKLLMLDPREMTFSITDLPAGSFKLGHAIVDAGDGRVGLLTFGPDGQTLVLRCKKWCGNGVDEQEWQHDKVIPLPDCCNQYIIIGSDEGVLLLQGIPRNSSQSTRMNHYFTLELKTLLVERFCVSNYAVDFACLFASFPPPLSLPSVRADIGQGSSRE